MLLFEPFEKISRFNRDVVITEKIDGTNALIAIADDGDELRIGSRSRWITPEDDNFGFARWVKEHEDDVRKLGPGYHYGEWWGAGVGRRYGLKEKRFSLFNVARWGAPETRPECVGVVPTLYTGPMFGPMGVYEVRECIEALRDEGSKAAPGFMDPEGIVIFHAASQTLFKVTIKGDEAPKGMVTK